MITNPTYRMWFLKPMQDMSPESVERGTMRLAPTPVALFEFDTKTLLRKFMVSVTYADWMENSTTIVKGAYDWLFMDPELVELVKHDFNMYHHHHRKMNNQGSLGWLRSIYYTQIQQIVRQDPSYYTLLAAASDNW